MTPEQTLFSIRQAHRWRDLLWDSILQDLESRNPASSAAAREAIRVHGIRRVTGDSGQQALLVWRCLDAQARADWIWCCSFVHHTWIRGAEVAYAPKDDDW